MPNTSHMMRPSARKEGLEHTSPAPNTTEKPMVIGLYGIPGSGKSFILSYLKQELDPSTFKFYEGSEKIAELVPGGLDAFRKLSDQEKAGWRGRAIDDIKRESVEGGHIAIVAGHFMFWSEADAAGTSVCTPNDLGTYTHVVYLEVDADRVAQHRLNDKLRSRPSESTGHLKRWQQAEISGLRQLCRSHGILFVAAREQADLPGRVLQLISHFQQFGSGKNCSRIESKLNEVLPKRHQLETVLVMDADKTLSAVDTGKLFWDVLAQTRLTNEGSPLNDIFGGPFGYSENAFLQATLLYEEVANDDDYDILCETVASSVTIHKDFVSLLQSVATEDHVGAVVVTCGLGKVWEKVLGNEGLSETVKVIGGGRMSDDFVITPEVKAAIVYQLRQVERLHVWAFGDSPLDIPMLKEAHEAIVVVGDKATRSRSMDKALLNALNTGELTARQVLLPDHGEPRLNTAQLPLVRLTDPGLVDSIMQCHGKHKDANPSRFPTFSSLRVLHATERPAAKLLMSPTRNASMAGPPLRKAHHDVGKYLALEYLSEVIGVEEYPIPHVQGHQTNGYRLRDEERTSIVALMRGGEPMAFGVNEVFPRAMFIHADSAADVKLHHLENQGTVVLVDSVINSGKTLIQFIEHVRGLQSIRIVVVAGVVQGEVVSEGHVLARLMAQHGVSLIALRISENKFTGTKTTDTGNRLFNTTHLP